MSFHSRSVQLAPWILAASLALPALGHDTGAPHDDLTTSTPLPFALETHGPVHAPAPIHLGAGTKTSGHGFWTFVAAPQLTPVPSAAMPKLKGAHGTIIVDKERELAYWGLENVGWIGFSNHLSQSWIIQGDPAFAKGNLHGADIFPRPGQLPLVVAADNVEGEVYLTDTSFQHAETLRLPPLPPYADKQGYAPTDAAFAGLDEIWVTDGYGKAFFFSASRSPFQFTGKYYGGKALSGTPHGITFDSRTQNLLISARPEGLIKRWDRSTTHVVDVRGLPPGSTICDTDVWGDYALAPCLDGPNGTPGPIYIVNLKKQQIVSTINPKTDLGYGEAQHIHDAAWYVTGKGSKQEVYILFTNWNPGGVGALKLVQVAKSE